MSLVEPAGSLTGFALGILALFAAARLGTRESTGSRWRWFFLWIGIAGICGGFHRGFIAAHETAAMAIVVALWVRAWQNEQPGGGLVLAAIFLSLLAAALKVSSVQFTLGAWEFDPNSIYHLAQMPGICLMIIAIQRRADAMEEQPLRQNGRLAAPA